MADVNLLDEGPREGGPNVNKYLIPGLPLVDTSKLHPDFRKVKGNQMYFVDRCTLYRKNNARGDDHIIVLSPGALFLLDFNGVMERATVYGHIMDLYQKKMKKGLMSFGTAEHHVLLKVPSEVDCHVSFSSSTMYQKFISILTKILETQRQKAVVVKNVSEDKEITHYYSDKAAEGYYTPREIADITRQRTVFDKCIANGQQDVYDLLEKVSRAKAQVSEREREVEALRQKGVDEDSIRRRKKAVEAKQVDLQRHVAAKHKDCERVLAAIRVLQSQLVDARGNTEALVEKGVAAALAEKSAQQNQTIALRRRAQQKERAALEEEIAALRQQTAAPLPQQSVKAKALDASIDAALVELETELEAGFRLEKFLATVNSEIEAQSDAISAINREKQKWLHEREKGKEVKAPEDVMDLLEAEPPKSPLGGGGGGGGGDEDMDMLL